MTIKKCGNMIALPTRRNGPSGNTRNTLSTPTSVIVSPYAKYDGIEANKNVTPIAEV